MINSALLKEEMEGKKINTVELSRISGMDKPVISRILKGETRSCTVGTAQKTAEALELNSTMSEPVFC